MRSAKTSTTGRWTRGRQEPETSARNDKKQKKLRNLAIPEFSAEERTRTFTGLTPTRPST